MADDDKQIDNTVVVPNTKTNPALALNSAQRGELEAATGVDRIDNSPESGWAVIPVESQYSQPTTQQEAQALAQAFSIGQAKPYQSAGEYGVAFKPAGLTVDQLSKAGEQMSQVTGKLTEKKAAQYKVIVEKKAGEIANVIENGSKQGMDPSIAALEQYPEILKEDRQDPTQKPLIHVAAKSNLVWTKKLLEMDNTQATRLDKDQATPLHEAARLDDPKIANYLIEVAPETAKMQDKKGRLPLHDAVDADRTHTAAALLESYPEGNRVRNNLGDMPIHYASKNGHMEITKLLLSKDPDLAYQRDGVDGKGNLPIHIAAGLGDVDLVKLYLAQDKGLANSKDASGKTVKDLLNTDGSITVSLEEHLDLISKTATRDKVAGAATALTGVATAASGLIDKVGDGFKSLNEKAADHALDGLSSAASSVADSLGFTQADAKNTQETILTSTTAEAPAPTAEAPAAGPSETKPTPAPAEETAAEPAQTFAAEGGIKGALKGGMATGLIGGIAALFLTGASGPISFIIAGIAALVAGKFGPDIVKGLFGENDIELAQAPEAKLDAMGAVNDKAKNDNEFNLRSADKAKDGKAKDGKIDLQEFSEATGIGDSKAAIKDLANNTDLIALRDKFVREGVTVDQEGSLAIADAKTNTSFTFKDVKENSAPNVAHTAAPNGSDKTHSVGG